MTPPQQLRPLVLLLLFGNTTDATAQNGLGRLLLTPEQRVELEQQRRTASSSEPEQRNPKQTFNGEVRRSSGKNTRWINDEARHDSTAVPPIPVGDSYDTTSGSHESLLREGTINIRPRQARQ